MPVTFYMDEHIRSNITEGLRKRGVDVLTAQEEVILARQMLRFWIGQVA
jgi:hypothetical protein